MSIQVTIDGSDLLKVYDALTAANTFLTLRDQMNARVHLAEATRYSPLTTAVHNARERLFELLRKEGYDL